MKANLAGSYDHKINTWLMKDILQLILSIGRCNNSNFQYFCSNVNCNGGDPTFCTKSCNGLENESSLWITWTTNVTKVSNGLTVKL